MVIMVPITKRQLYNSDSRYMLINIKSNQGQYIQLWTSQDGEIYKLQKFVQMQSYPVGFSRLSSDCYTGLGIELWGRNAVGIQSIHVLYSEYSHTEGTLEAPLVSGDESGSHSSGLFLGELKLFLLFEWSRNFESRDEQIFLLTSVYYIEYCPNMFAIVANISRILLLWNRQKEWPYC